MLILFYEFHLNKLLGKEKMNGCPYSAQIQDSVFKTRNYIFVLKSYYYGQEKKSLGKA